MIAPKKLTPGYRDAAREAMYLHNTVLGLEDFPRAIENQASQAGLPTKIQPGLAPPANRRRRLTISIVEKLLLSGNQYLGKSSNAGIVHYRTLYVCADTILSDFMSEILPHRRGDYDALCKLRPFYDHFLRIAGGDLSRAQHPELKATFQDSLEPRKRVNEDVDALVRFLGKHPIFKPIPDESREKFEQDLRMLLKQNAKPLLYYHWRQRHDHLHLVDYIFLWILRSMERFGFEPYGLVTDQIGMKDEQWLRAAGAILGPDRLTTLTTAQKDKHLYLEHARKYGHEVKLKRVLEHRDASAQTWIPWIRFNTVRMNRGGHARIVWDRRQGTHDLGNIFDDGLTVAPLLTGDFAINDRRLKNKNETEFELLATKAHIERWLFDRESSLVDDELPKLMPFLQNVHVEGMTPSEASSSESASCEIAAGWERLSSSRGLAQETTEAIVELALLLDKMGLGRDAGAEVSP